MAKRDMAREAALVGLYHAGATQGELGDIYGISKQFVSVILRRAGCKSVSGRKSNIDPIRVVRESQRLGSIPRAAVGLGISSSAIYKVFRELGISYPNRFDKQQATAA